MGCAVGHLAKLDRLGVGVFQSLVVLCGLSGSKIPILGSVVENLRNRRAVTCAGAFLIGMDVFDSSACLSLSRKSARRNSAMLDGEVRTFPFFCESLLLVRR